MNKVLEFWKFDHFSLEMNEEWILDFKNEPVWELHAKEYFWNKSFTVRKLYQNLVDIV